MHDLAEAGIRGFNEEMAVIGQVPKVIYFMLLRNESFRDIKKG